MNNKINYEKGKLYFKGLNFSWDLITTEKNEHGEHEVFNIEITNPINKKTIRQTFHNSIMEKRVSDKLNQYKNKIVAINYLKPNMWGGYDTDLKGKKLTNLRQFNQMRLYWLLYGIINDFAMYFEFEQENPIFEDFALSFGYNEDSKKHEEIYRACLHYARGIRSLQLSEEIKEYYNDVIKPEEEEFNDLLKFEILNQY